MKCAGTCRLPSAFRASFRFHSQAPAWPGRYALVGSHHASARLTQVVAFGPAFPLDDASKCFSETDATPPGLESQPSSRTGENPPYGMIGRIEETSASFEARSAPRSYPTPISGLYVVRAFRTVCLAI